MIPAASLRAEHERAQERAWRVAEALPEHLALVDYDAMCGSIVAEAVAAQCRGTADDTEIYHSAQRWWLEQFVATEMTALRLAVSILEDADAWPAIRLNVADQVSDEARHFAVFTELAADIPSHPGEGTQLGDFTRASLEMPAWQLRHAALSLLLETQALSALRVLRHDGSAPRAAWAARLVLSDEGRHVKVGRLVTQSWFDHASVVERREAGDWLSHLCRCMSTRYRQGPCVSGSLVDLTHSGLFDGLRREVTDRVSASLAQVGFEGLQKS